MSANVPIDMRTVVESNHTRTRPPHLNDENFHSTQADGPGNEPIRPYPNSAPCSSAVSTADMDRDLDAMILEDGGDFAKYPPSLGSDSTMSAKAYVDPKLKTRVDLIGWMFERPVEPTQLTILALQALDYDNDTQGYHRDLAGWCEHGNMLVHDSLDAKLTDSMLLPHRAKSQVTELTTSSYDMLSDITALNNTDSEVSGAGAVFDDIPRAPDLEDDIDMVRIS